MNLNIGGDIVNGATVRKAVDGDIHVSGKIDENSFVELVSTQGSITIDGKVDNHSVVRLTAAGAIRIGVVGGDGDKMVNGGSQVHATADGAITLGSKVDGGSSVVFVSNKGNVTIDGKVDGSSQVTVQAMGNVVIGAIGGEGDTMVNGSSEVRVTADGDITLGSKVDGSSTAVLVSNHKTITIKGKVDGSSIVSLIAAGDISIGTTVGGGGDRKIDGNSHVDATSGGAISLGNWIHGNRSTVDFKACTGITIVDEIANGATVRLMTSTGSIHVGGKIGDSDTHVTFFPPGSLTAAGGIDGGTDVHAGRWADPAVGCMEPAPITGYWWQNWPQTFGYVSTPRAYPRTLEELDQAIVSSGPVGTRPIPGPALKAVGGGWSFTDASLPFQTQAEVDQASMVIRGASRTQDLQYVLQGIGDVTSSPMDLWPETVHEDLAFERHWDQTSMTQRTVSGEVLPGSSKVRLIDTRGLASSLQCELAGILSDSAKRREEAQSGADKDKTFLFHVEGGITMADLAQLLDHQHPRMAIQASGGSPGATLAGTLSTATHGGEFNRPLLVDRVRAIHMVGPGGEEWWIEGKESIADPVKLHNRYPKLDAAHFIGGAWNAIPGLKPQDVLNAVIVSMGTMGVIYSIVFEVVPQFGLQQIVTSMPYADLLAIKGITEDQLRSGDVAANQKLLDVILDGSKNGTGIPRSENVYADLAINPINRDCWITNRRVTKHLPIDSNSPAATMDDYMTALSTALTSHAVDNVQGSRFAGRIFDFLDYGTDLVSLVQDIGHVMSFARFVTRFPDVLSAVAATISAQTVANIVNAPFNIDRGQQFVGDLLTGFLNALQGTSLGKNSDRTDISYKVGAIGWPDGGLPGRGLEIAMDQTRAFSFLQKVLLDDVFANTVILQNKPLLGYISIRVCPQTRTLMGMQQYRPFSVMTEVVAYRSPEANVLMDLIQAKVLEMNRKERLQALLHWGLENQMLTAADLPLTPLGDAIDGSSTISKLDAFKSVRKFLLKGYQPVFDNNFVARLQL